MIVFIKVEGLMEGLVRTECKKCEFMTERESVSFLSEGWEFFLLQ